MDEYSHFFQVKYILKKITINFKKFYEFLTNLKNCMQIFYYDESALNRTSSVMTPDNEEVLCLICYKRKNSIMLKCYVLINIFIKYQ